MKPTRLLSAALLALSIAPVGAQPLSHGVDKAGIDAGVRPGNDFFAYANGAWLKKTEIPADRNSVGIWTRLSDITDAQVRTLIADSAAGKDRSPDARRVGDYYAAFLDTATIEAKGLTPLQGDLATIRGITNRQQLSAYLGTTLRADVDALNSTDFYTDHVFGLWANQSFEQPTRNVAYLLQGGLGLPDREYYLADTPDMVKLRAAYRAHIVKVLSLAAIAKAEEKADRILTFEIAIARTHAARAESEDVHKADNPWKRADFAVKAPGMDWNAFFAAAGLADQNDFDAWHPSAIKGISGLVQTESLDTWKDYLTFHLLDHYSSYLPKAFDDERFAFYGSTLSGTTKQRERWQRAIAVTNAALGPAVGRLYVERHFPPAAKAKIAHMVDELIVAYRKRIEALDWMSPATKEKALAKLTTLKVGVGYPDAWTEYSALAVERGEALSNVRRAEAFRYAQALDKLKKPADRGEWAMDPQEINAVNLPLANALNFPAAILQPPFFDPEADDATNFGAIGSIIGHEISHSFDDQGSQFDAQGRLQNWWTPEDGAHFTKAGQALAAQFDGYRPFPDLAVDGKQTLSENIADVAGLSAAFDAYKLSLNGKADKILDGLSGEQRFFLSFAQNWRTKTRDKVLRQQILTDGHAPAQYRAQTVRNLDAWYDAFGIGSGDALYLAPQTRVRVW